MSGIRRVLLVWHQNAVFMLKRVAAGVSAHICEHNFLSLHRRHLCMVAEGRSQNEIYSLWRRLGFDDDCWTGITTATFLLKGVSSGVAGHSRRQLVCVSIADM
jgi:hypothetical protein